jgi:hypothetical protein
MATIAIAALLVAQGVRVFAAESETDPAVPCPAEQILWGVCKIDTEYRAVCIIAYENQNCTSSN